MIGGIIVEKPTVIISMSQNSTKKEIADMRNKYKNEYKIHIIISGTESPKEIMKNFLSDALTK